MPRGLKRFHETGNFHFLTFSCYHRQPFFDAPSARGGFEASLERMRGTVEIESVWTAAERAHQLPEGFEVRKA